MMIHNARELINAIRTKRDKMNEKLEAMEEYKMTKSTSLSASKMRELRKDIRQVITKRDKLDNTIDEIEEQTIGRLQTTPVS